MTHEKKLLCFLLTLASTIVSGFEAMPATTPFTGSIQVLYTPNFEASCTSKTSEKNQGEQFGNNKTNIVKFLIKKTSPEGVRLSIAGAFEGKPMSMIIPVKSDRTGLIMADFEFDNFSMTDKEKEALGEGKKIIGQFLEKFIGPGFNKPLQLGSERTFPSICSLLPNGKMVNNTGSFKVIGTAFIRGRENIVFGGEQSITCAFDEKQFSMKIKGWESIDRQSGLPSDTSTSMEVSATGNGDNIMTVSEVRTCAITGAAVYQPTPSPSVTTESKSVEQRLTDLKRLLDARLISQEQYQRKSSEILESL